MAEPLHEDQDTVQQEELISQELFSLFLGVNPQITTVEAVEYKEDIESFIQKLAKKQSRYRSEKQFLKYAFYKIHNRYLKRYTDHTDLYDLLNKGQYDCITGSAFYALILNALNIEYTIHELPYHVYLLVQLKNEKGNILLESTDARSGFVEDPERITQIMEMYAQDIPSEKADHYTYSFEINAEIELKQLAALNYYNEAVVYYNQQNLKQATHYLNYASQLYPARRMETLRMLIDEVTKQPISSAGR
ncbi:hypothetical protein [Catalinimonas niigatensis]|uniref:hypothetical protein n=1 Tax=Catalinimonas niigatensis TaxID=1397264 RepID=UPI0026650D00|nr:hypothetical protein [Catalinimonas niigatensis]WPP52390.1 hypothetical protein PZB72_08345 [Catalinimonas niigatensis]